MNSAMTLKIHLLLIAVSVTSWLLPQGAQAQGGTGSKGGVVLACFNNSNPKRFMREIPGTPLYRWPTSAEDASDNRVGFANKALVFEAVNQLKYVQVAEYAVATGKSWS